MKHPYWKLCSLSVLFLTTLVGLPSSFGQEIDPLDWPHWRGPEQNGISREKGLVESWSPEGENLLWKRADLATRTTPIVMRGKLYMLCRSEPGTKKEGEKVVCVDAATGETIWENKFNVFLSDVPDVRVAWSCCVGDPKTGRVYAMGVCGYFQCLDGETGKTIWSRSLNEEFGLLTTYGGRTNIPVLFEDLAIISGVFINWGEAGKPDDKSLEFDKTIGGRKDMAKPAHRFLALDKNTGDIVWFSGTRLLPEDTTYSTPTVAVLGGQAALVVGAGDGAVYAFQPRTGKVIWRYNFSRRGLNVPPLVVGDRVITGQSEENRDDSTMGSLVVLDGTLSGDITQKGEIWRVKEKLMVGRSQPILAEGRIFAIDDSAGLFFVDPKTGKEVAKKFKLGTIMHGSPLYADGKIYCCDTNGRWYILQPNDKGVKVLHKLRLNGEEVQGSPIVSHGRIYLPTNKNLYCIGKKDHEPSADKIPEPPQEDPADKDPKPALVQIVPAELLLKPGQEQKFSVRVFNSRGRLLKSQPAEFSVDGKGEVSAEGVYVADSVPDHSAAYVTAKVGDLSSTSRIRVVPPLPWKFDFENIPLAEVKGRRQGEPPVTWMGMRYRHAIREKEGNKYMVKITTIPKGTRSQGWMGPVDLHDYAIQADVQGDQKNGKMPDIGLIAQRYTLDMMGVNQKLQIRSWTPQLGRFSQTIDFAWKPQVWYTMKFQASVEEGKAVLKGKVWERGQEEPQKWTIEAVDETPNVTGSPGLFGNANDAEISIDNITVTPNK